MNRSKWFFHPLFIFIFSILALAFSLFLYIYWYVRVSTGLEAMIRRFHISPEQALQSQTWVVILVLSVLVALILAGIFTIFVYNQKLWQLYRLQQNFINNFTHELKTPVTSLKLYLETFLKYDLSRGDQLRYIQYMHQDARRLSDNINRILNLARIESKSYGGEFVRQDLVETVQCFCKKNQHLFPHCQIRVHPPAGPFCYPINRSLFEMLLMNLLSNADKYNRSDSPRTDIRFFQEKKRYQISFQDNGIGLEKRDLKKIFRKFYQVGRSENMSARGSGLGLYLVQLIARLHGGRVAAQSNGRNQGTEFVLTLPIKRGDTHGCGPEQADPVD